MTSHVLQVRRWHDGRRQPLARLQHRGPGAGAASSPERIATVKQMHRLLYRDGSPFEQARERIAALADDAAESQPDVAPI